MHFMRLKTSNLENLHDGGLHVRELHDVKLRDGTEEHL